MTTPTAPRLTPRSRSALAWALIATAAWTAADLASKEWALNELSVERMTDPPPICEPDEFGNPSAQRMRKGAIVLIEGYLELRYAENCGAAFGLMRAAPHLLRKGVFFIAAIAATLALFWMFIQGRGGPCFAWSVPLIVSGAVGNLADRIRYGYVVDFIRFHTQETWEWPTFNIADSTITVGVVLLLIDGFTEGKRERAAQAQAERHAEESTS